MIIMVLTDLKYGIIINWEGVGLGSPDILMPLWCSDYTIQFSKPSNTQGTECGEIWHSSFKTVQINGVAYYSGMDFKITCYLNVTFVLNANVQFFSEKY